MSAATDYFEDALRTLIFRTAAGFAKTAVLAIGLYTAAPGEAGGGTEVTGGAYARVSNNPLDANWTAASATDGLTDNAGLLTYPTPSANWGLVTHHALSDATSAGNMLIYGLLTAAKTINNGDPAPTWPIGDYNVTIA
jgi:hypothetical protein